MSVRQERGDTPAERRLLITVASTTPVYTVTVDLGVGSAAPAAGVGVRTIPAVTQVVRAINDTQPGRVRLAVASPVPLRATGGAMLMVTLSTDEPATVDLERVKINEGQTWTPGAGGRSTTVR